MIRRIILFLVNNIRSIVISTRSFYYKIIFNKVGLNTIFLGKINYYGASYISFGNDCSINEGVFLNCSTHLNVGNNVTISANVFITTVGLNADAFPRKEHYDKGVSIEDDAWIGAGSIILPGVTIGKGSIIGAGSVVTRDTLPNYIYLGAPAKLLRKIND